MNKDKSIASLALAAVMGMTPVAIVRADMTPGASGSPAASDTATPPAQGQMVSGSVTNVDPVNQTLQVKDSNGQTQTFAVTPTLEITKNDQAASLNDIKIGDVVTVKTKASKSNS